MNALSRPFDSIGLDALILRLLLATISGAVIGFGRSRRDRNAGLRTYLLVCVGSAAATMISLYEYQMLTTLWADLWLTAGSKFDVSRIASLAVTGIGFCGAGLIVKISYHQVQGLTTATGLFSTVCLGIAIGLGFYECAIPGLVAIVIVLNVLSPLKGAYRRKLKSITLRVEFNAFNDISAIVEKIENSQAEVQEVNVDPPEESDGPPSAVFILHLTRDMSSHTAMMTTIAEMDCVQSVQELIA